MNLWLGVGGAIVDGVLTENPKIARLAVEVTVLGEVITLPPTVTFGPFREDTGPFGAFALFDAAVGGSTEFTATFTGLTVSTGEFLSFPAGNYMMTPAVTPSSSLLTIGGVPLTVAGQPLGVGTGD